MMDFHTYLSQLKVLGSVPPGGRLGHSLGGSLFVARDGVVTNALRFVLGEGRVRTCSTITTLLAAANERLVDMENSRYLDENPCSERYDLEQRARQLADALGDAAKGIENLQVTYALDCAAVAHLQVLTRKCGLVLSRADALARASAAQGRFAS